MFSVFQQHCPDLVVELNTTVPRRGAFELTVINADGVGMLVLVSFSSVAHVLIVGCFLRDASVEWIEAGAASQRKVS